MTAVAARRLILIYVALSVLLFGVVLLPGGPTASSQWSLGFWIVFESLLVWLLWNRSRLAWAVLAFVALSTFPLFVLVGASDAGSIAVSVVTLGQFVILVTPSMLRFVWSRPRTPLVG